MKLDVLGVNGENGSSLMDSIDAEAVVDIAREEAKRGLHYHKAINHRFTTKWMGLPFGVSELDIRKAGWAVVFASSTKDEVRAALEPLIEHRRNEVEEDRFHVLEVNAGETHEQWRARHGNAPGSVEPWKIPYYILLVGDPCSISFAFQYDLDVEFAVGRVSFDRVDDYAVYAESVVLYERENGILNDRRVVYWGPSRDGATKKSAEFLLTPLWKGSAHEEAIAPSLRFEASAAIGDTANRRHLIETLHAPSGALPPAVLFTASHGLAWRREHPSFAAVQGALGSSELVIGQPALPEQYIAAGDLADSARVGGMIAFLFACYSAGTPKHDTYKLVRMGGQLANEPFIAALPKRLLSHPKGGALAVIGHVDLAFSGSFHSDSTGSAVLPFRNFLGHVLAGAPVGHAMTDMNRRYASLSAALGSLIDPNRPSPYNDPIGTAVKWAARNDARGYIVLGDPACRLRDARLNLSGS